MALFNGISKKELTELKGGITTVFFNFAPTAKDL
jgi:hypothetical protein